MSQGPQTAVEPVPPPALRLESESTTANMSQRTPGNTASSPTLRVTRVYANGERAVESVDVRGLGAYHEKRMGRCLSLTWETRPEQVLVVATPHSPTAVAALPIAVSSIRGLGTVNVFVESDTMADVVEQSDLLEPKLRPNVITFTSGNDGRPKRVAEEVDFVVCLGGDGLILHVVSRLFPEAVPPIMPFNMGSLGFLTPFDFKSHKAEIARVLNGQNNSVTMRMRLKCTIVPKSRSVNERPFRPISEPIPTSTFQDALGPSTDEAQQQQQRDDVDDNAVLPETNQCPPGLLEYHVLNEIVIDRGPAPYLSNLEVFADDCPVTRVQADGLIVATPTGSTAYSLSCGGSMVHPSVPAILFTPICPHSLSFRPVLFPLDAVLQIKVPEDARASAWVSFDGRHRMELQKGDKVVVCMSRFPVPTFSRQDPTSDWFASVSQCLRWNERVAQAPMDTYSDANLTVGEPSTTTSAEDHSTE